MSEEPVIRLYGPTRAPFTQKVLRALRLKGLEFEFFEPEGPEDYKRWSPKTGLLPVIEIDGEHIPDSTDILYRLDELFPEPPLLSADPRIAGQQRQLEDWADSNLSRSFNQWSALGEQRQDGDENTSAFRNLWHWLRAGGTWERPEISIVRELGSRLDDLIGFLGTREFFYSDTPSMADLSVYSMLIVMRADFIPGSAKLLEPRGVLREFMERVEAATGGNP
jgi:glutathione S-transferase